MTDGYHVIIRRAGWFRWNWQLVWPDGDGITGHTRTHVGAWWNIWRYTFAYDRRHPHR